MLYAGVHIVFLVFLSPILSLNSIPRTFSRQSHSDKFEIIAGERRWLASQNAGLHEVPVVILDVDDVKSLEFAIVENVQRQDLNPIEEAKSYQSLINDFNYNQEKLSQFI